MSGLCTHGSTIKIEDKYAPSTMPLPARLWFFQRVQNQDPKKFHNASNSTTGPLSSCLLKRNQKNTIWRKGSSHYVPTCTMSPVFSTRPNKTSPRLAKDSPFNFHPPPSKTTTGPLSSCLLKRTRKHHLEEG